MPFFVYVPPVPVPSHGTDKKEISSIPHEIGFSFLKRTEVFPPLLSVVCRSDGPHFDSNGVYRGDAVA